MSSDADVIRFVRDQVRRGARVFTVICDDYDPLTGPVWLATDARSGRTVTDSVPSDALAGLADAVTLRDWTDE